MTAIEEVLEDPEELPISMIFFPGQIGFLAPDRESGFAGALVPGLIISAGCSRQHFTQLFHMYGRSGLLLRKASKVSSVYHQTPLLRAYVVGSTLVRPSGVLPWRSGSTTISILRHSRANTL